MIKNICVYCSSSTKVDQDFFDFTRQFGKRLAAENYTLVFGGADVGLMGHLARTVTEHNGTVIGVIPEVARGTKYVFEPSAEMIFAPTVRERKALMDQKSDAFIALPGGFGTLDEIIEMLTLKQIRVHDRPVIFANRNGFYDPLNAVFEQMFLHNFASNDFHQHLYYMANTIDDIFTYLQTYQPPDVPAQWY